MFPNTPQTLLRKIAELAQGDDAAEWEAFVELYTPSLRNFIRQVNQRFSSADLDDAVQEVFIKLVGILRAGKVDRKKGSFRAYLASMTRHLLIDRYRATLVRPAQPTLPNDESADTCSLVSIPSEAIDPGVVFDLKWRVAVHAAAVDHVLNHTAISAQSRAIYQALDGEESLRTVAQRFGVSYDVVKQVKSRLDRAIAAFESRVAARP